jgi:hypothetical protein
LLPSLPAQHWPKLQQPQPHWTQHDSSHHLQLHCLLAPLLTHSLAWHLRLHLPETLLTLLLPGDDHSYPQQDLVVSWGWPCLLLLCVLPA